MVPAPTLTDDDLDVLSRRFGRAHPEAVITWAVEQFHPRLVLATSMTDAVLVDLAVRVEPAIEVVFIDTGYHFPETLATVDAVRRRYGLNLKVMRAPEPAVPLWQADPEHCCASLKVALLDDALAGREAWMSGLRRAESPTRAAAPIVSRDHRGLVKVNPLATWDDLDVACYIADRDIVVNPLLDQGYPSIGCAPCTRPVAPGEHARDGRWDGRKLECGLHPPGPAPAT